MIVRSEPATFLLPIRVNEANQTKHTVTIAWQEQQEERMSIFSRLKSSTHATYSRRCKGSPIPALNYGSHLEPNMIFELTEASHSDNALPPCVDPVTSHHDTKLF